MMLCKPQARDGEHDSTQSQVPGVDSERPNIRVEERVLVCIWT